VHRARARACVCVCVCLQAQQQASTAQTVLKALAKEPRVATLVYVATPTPHLPHTGYLHIASPQGVLSHADVGQCGLVCPQPAATQRTTATRPLCVHTTAQRPLLLVGSSAICVWAPATSLVRASIAWCMALVTTLASQVTHPQHWAVVRVCSRFTGLPLPRAMLAFVNQKCGVHRALDGSLNAAGRAIRRLEVRTWGASAVGSAEDLRTSDEEQISSDEEQPSSDGADVARGADPSWRVAESQVDDGKEEYTCERVDAATLTFMREYVVRSRPVVITGAASAQRFRHWNVDFFRQKLGSHTVHVKVRAGKWSVVDVVGRLVFFCWPRELCAVYNGVVSLSCLTLLRLLVLIVVVCCGCQVSNTGDFEGPEPLSWWTRGGDTLQPPDAVLAQLQSPHLVLVRPAAVDLPFSEFMDRLQSANAQRQFHPTPTCGGGDGDGEGEGAGEGEGKGETERGAASAAPTCADPSVGGPTDAHVPSYYIEYLSLESYGCLVLCGLGGATPCCHSRCVVLCCVVPPA